MYFGKIKPTETTSSVLRSTYTGNGSTTTYALPGPVANETSIIATINGVTQQDGAYSTNGSQIIFDAAPALGDAIEIRTISDVGMSYAPSAGSVVTGILADGAVTTGKIADSSITTAKIAAGAVVQADLASNVAGTGPAFSAYKTSSQSYSANTWTKITYDTEEYDTNSNFASSTFTPTVAGYYLFTARNQLIADGTAMSEMNSAFYKNGSIAKSGAYKYQPASATAQFGSNISAVIFCNGSTDYVECYARTDGTTLTIFGSAGAGATNSYFQGTLMRTS